MDQKINLKEPKEIIGLVLTDGMLLELLEKKEVPDTIYSRVSNKSPYRIVI